MVSKLEKQSFWAQAEAEQRRIQAEIAAGKRPGPSKQRLGRHPDSDFARMRAGDHEPRPEPNERVHWSERPWQAQIKLARNLYTGHDATDAIPTARLARRFLAEYYAEQHLFPELFED